VQNLKIIQENQFLERGYPQRLLLVQHNRQNVLDVNSSDSDSKPISYSEFHGESIDRSLARGVLNQGKDFHIIDEL
jgi:hypothetical protein